MLVVYFPNGCRQKMYTPAYSRINFNTNIKRNIVRITVCYISVLIYSTEFLFVFLLNVPKAFCTLSSNFSIHHDSMTISIVHSLASLINYPSVVYGAPPLGRFLVRFIIGTFWIRLPSPAHFNRFVFLGTFSNIRFIIKLQSPRFPSTPNYYLILLI